MGFQRYIKGLDVAIFDSIPVLQIGRGNRDD